MGRMPLAGRDLRPYGTGPDWVSLRTVREESLAGEASSDDQSDHLCRHQTPRIKVHDCQASAAARAATPSEDGPPDAHPPIFRRVWQEVAPGQWRWIHVDDQAAPK